MPAGTAQVASLATGPGAENRRSWDAILQLAALFALWKDTGGETIIRLFSIFLFVLRDWKMSALTVLFLGGIQQGWI
jgi:hypothetical protein